MRITSLREYIPHFSLIALTLLVATSLQAAQASDGEITAWVNNALRHDSRIEHANVQVKTAEGIVSLDGSVPTIASQQFAEREAAKIHGVRGVVNEIEVVAEARSDVDIVHDIRQRIENDATIESENLRVSCLDGHVSLSGEVASYAEELETELIASEVRGVKKVSNHLLTSYISKRGDEQTKKDVLATLARDVYLTGLPITVSVKNGVATLAGKTGNMYQKFRAEDDIHKMTDVKAIENNLVVEPGQSDGIRNTDGWRSEEELDDAIKAELMQDGRIDASKISATAEYGHVMINGSVKTRRQQRLAEQDIRDVVGVAWVTNNLTINARKRDSLLILADVRINLSSDAMLHSFPIKTTVADGRVTLAGKVDTSYQKQHAQEIANRVSGALEVKNNLQVDRGKEHSDDELVTTIKQRLEHNAHTHDCQRTVNVDVVNGVALLTGTVDDWVERKEAERVAFHTDGVWKVENRVIIEGVDYRWEEWHQEFNRDYDPMFHSDFIYFYS